MRNRSLPLHTNASHSAASTIPSEPLPRCKMSDAGAVRDHRACKYADAPLRLLISLLHSLRAATPDTMTSGGRRNLFHPSQDPTIYAREAATNGVHHGRRLRGPPPLRSSLSAGAPPPAIVSSQATGRPQSSSKTITRRANAATAAIPRAAQPAARSRREASTGRFTLPPSCPEPPGRCPRRIGHPHGRVADLQPPQHATRRPFLHAPATC